MLYPLECTDYAEAQPTTQNTKPKESDPMEGIGESNNKAEQRPTSRQAAAKAKEKIKSMLRDTMGVALYSQLGSVADSTSLLTLFHVCFDLIATLRFIIIQNTRIFCGKLPDNNAVV